MNIEQAQCIPMSTILEKINCKPVKETAKDIWYISPLREEKTPSFHISKKVNIWHDFGTGEGGKPLKFVCAYLLAHGENDTIQDALRWLKNMVGLNNLKPFISTKTEDSTDCNFQLKSVGQLKHFGLNHYLKKRGVDQQVGFKYLKEVKLLNRETLKSITALGLKNEENGYELRNPMIKSSIGAKSITFIRGVEPKPKGINIFEGMFDYLSVVTLKNTKALQNDTIILNSNSLINKALPYIRNYGYEIAYTWLDNDKSGEDATNYLHQFFSNEERIVHKPMNYLYQPFNDVNSWHMNKLGISNE
ncbi:MAG: toprim domain-containing protein [Bacteroidota bacterium]